MTTKNAQNIQVIDRAVSLMEAIARYPDPVSLKILTAETELHASTAHRILASLISNRMVEKVGGGRYKLGPALLRLGARMKSNVDIRELAKPIISRLRDKLGESVNLTIREGDVVVYIERATPNRMMHVHQLVGSRAPLHVTAVGKLMLGAGGDQECRGYYERTNLPAYTRNTIRGLEELHANCIAAFEEGFAMDNEEAEIGVGCIGVLIFDSNEQVVAGLSVSAPIERRQEGWIPEIRSAALEISSKLGFRPA